VTGVAELTSHDDLCLPFQIEDADVRGQIVRLGPAVDEVLSKHDYPPAVSVLVGELLALVVMFGTSLKFDGKLSLQTKSDGPVSMVVADFIAPNTVRAYAQFDGKALKGSIAGKLQQEIALGDLVGEGHFAMIIDQGPDTERYQGIVPLRGATIGECVQTYFLQSEQIATSIKASVAQTIQATPDGSKESWRAGAIMIQHLPKPKEDRGSKDEDPAEIWNRVNILLETAEDHELLDPTLTSEQLLCRLYHEDGVRIFDPRRVRAGCSCRRQSVLAVIERFSQVEKEEIAEDGIISASCEFCNTTYDFDVTAL